MYKVGQIVKVVNTELKSYGNIGKIVSVDETWSYPYEIEFENGVTFEDELYAHSDVQVYIGENGKIKTKSIEDTITELIVLIATENHTRENALTVTKLQEAKMWYVQGKKMDEMGK